jgi:hypothetical protein
MLISLFNKLNKGLVRLMDILVIEQVWAIVFLLLGAFVLNTCSRLDRKDQEFIKDLRNCYGKQKSDMVTPKTLRGTHMTLTGTGFYLGGMILFMMHV